MKVVETKLPGVRLLESSVHRDTRGYFEEVFRHQNLSLLGDGSQLVQDNHSRSQKNVLRGLHFQEPHAQGKLVRVLAGSLQDVVVDVRRGSPNFGQWCSFDLAAGDGKSLWIPGGFAHGILALEDNTDLFYKVTNYWSPEAERTIRWDDPDINITWQSDTPLLNKNDAQAPYLRDIAELPKYARDK